MCNVSGVFPEAPVSVMVHFFHVDRKQIPFTSFGISLILSPPLTLPGRAHIQTSSVNSSLPLQRSPLLHCRALVSTSAGGWLRYKLHRPPCPSSNFSARRAQWWLPPPRCSRSLATASPVPRAPYPRRAPASPSGAPLSPQARPLPIMQVCFMHLLSLVPR